MPDDPHGNTATLLSDLSNSDAKAINIVSDLFGAVADIAGAVGAVSALVGLVSSLFAGPDEVQQAMAAIISAMNTAFNTLDKELGASQILMRNTTINNALSTPIALITSLQATLNTPISAGDRLNQITQCLAAVEALDGTAMPDTLWNVDFDWIAYWNDKGVIYSATWNFSQDADNPGWQQGPRMDVGYGPQNPPKNAGNLTVFNYTYTLPAYILAAAIFMSIGVALDPNFAANYATPLSNIISTLQARHDLIYNTGFVTLQPVPWAPFTLLYLSTGTQGFINNGPPQYTDANGNTVDAPNGATLYFAVVERFSGAGFMQSNYTVTLNLPGTDPAANTPDAGYRKMQLRILRMQKQLYVSTGLAQLDAIQNQVRRVLGQAIPTTPSLADWSIRRDFIPTMGFPAETSGGYSLGSLAKHVRNVPPTDGVGSQQVSLRTLFAGS